MGSWLGRAAQFMGCLCIAVAPACGPDVTEEHVASEGDDLASCTSPAEIFLWSSRDSLMPIAKGLTPNLPCTQYYVVLPNLVLDKTKFEPNVKAEIAQIHKLGSNFHAVAQFNHGAWESQLPASATPGDWQKAGERFRAEMKDLGFDIHPGTSDTWVVQELPSTLMTPKAGVDRHAVRGNVVGLVKGLTDGDGTVPSKMGGVVRVGVPQTPSNAQSIPVHHANMEDLILDEGFWNGIRPYVRWWGEEVYADAHDVCSNDANDTVAARAARVNSYVNHLPRLAAVGPAGAEAARTFLAKTFVPWLNGAWNADVGYGDNRITSDQMQDLLSLQVYAARSWQKSHPTSGAAKLAFAWVPIVSAGNKTEEAAVAAQTARLVSALADVYEKNQPASYACSPSGAYTHCACKMPGKSFGASADAWGPAFGRW